MSLYGYKPKTKAANWQAAFPLQQPPKASKAPARRNRIRPQSKAAQKRTREYSAMAKEFIKAATLRGQKCPVVTAVEELKNGRRYGWPVSAKITEVHHMRGRAGTLLTATQFWLAVSKAGHRWIHSNPAAAREMGWLCQPGHWNTPA